MTDMTFSDYQKQTHATAIYPEARALEYVTLGLVSEAGELAGKVKKVIRDHGGLVDRQMRADMAAELGDVLWYVAELCRVLGVDMGTVAAGNLRKLADRAERGVLGGSGDAR